MTPSDADTIASFITQRLTFLDGGSWEDQSIREDSRWGDTALAPVASLVGDVSRIRYAGGFVGRPSQGDQKVTEVRIVVFTDTQIIRVEAATDVDAPSLFLNAAKVWAVRRDSVTSVAVTRSSRTDDDSSKDWPRQLDIEISLSDETTVSLPLNPERYNRDYEGLQLLAQELFARE